MEESGFCPREERPRAAASGGDFSKPASGRSMFISLRTFSRDLVSMLGLQGPFLGRLERLVPPDASCP